MMLSISSQVRVYLSSFAQGAPDSPRRSRESVCRTAVVNTDASPSWDECCTLKTVPGVEFEFDIFDDDGLPCRQALGEGSYSCLADDLLGTSHLSASASDGNYTLYLSQTSHNPRAKGLLHVSITHAHEPHAVLYPPTQPASQPQPPAPPHLLPPSPAPSRPSLPSPRTPPALPPPPPPPLHPMPYAPLLLPSPRTILRVPLEAAAGVAAVALLMLLCRCSLVYRRDGEWGVRGGSAPTAALRFSAERKAGAHSTCVEQSEHALDE
eukprot:6200211-Pleurochrysis_carterae.AAC.7